MQCWKGWKPAILLNKDFNEKELFYDKISQKEIRKYAVECI